MHYLQNGSQSETRPESKPQVGNRGYFTESGANGQPSWPGADWFNAVIEEFQGALVAAGIDFDPERFDHLSQLLGHYSAPDASTEVKGRIEIATTQEVQAGTDTSRAVTPAGLKAAVPDATTTAKGKIEVATNEEVAAGTDASKAVTPSALHDSAMIKDASGNTSTTGDITAFAGSTASRYASVHKVAGDPEQLGLLDLLEVIAAKIDELEAKLA